MSNTDSHERGLVIEYVKVSEKVKDLNDKLKHAKRQMEHASTKIREYMEARDATATATYEHLGRVQINKPRLYASVTQENQEAVMSFLREIKRDDLVKESINANSLSKFVSERIEKGEEIPETISYYLKPQLAVYGGKS